MGLSCPWLYVYLTGSRLYRIASAEPATCTSASSISLPRPRGVAPAVPTVPGSLPGAGVRYGPAVRQEKPGAGPTRARGHRRDPPPRRIPRRRLRAAPSIDAAWAGRRLERGLIARRMAGEDAKLHRPRHDGLGGPMRRGQTLFWTITGSIVAAVAIAIALVLVNSGTPPKTASSPVPSASASASPHASPSAPVVIPETSSTSSFSYLSDLTPSGNLAELVNPGAVKISGSIYPKSISLYCNVGDQTSCPAYKLKRNDRRFQATIGLEAKWPPNFQAGVILVGDGRTLRTFSASVLRPKTVNVNVAGVHTLQLECFGSGVSSTAGWAVAVAWGNARISAGH